MNEETFSAEHSGQIENQSYLVDVDNTDGISTNAIPILLEMETQRSPDTQYSRCPPMTKQIQSCHNSSAECVVSVAGFAGDQSPVTVDLRSNSPFSPAPISNTTLMYEYPNQSQNQETTTLMTINQSDVKDTSVSQSHLFLNQRNPVSQEHSFLADNSQSVITCTDSTVRCVGPGQVQSSGSEAITSDVQIADSTMHVNPSPAVIILHDAYVTPDSIVDQSDQTGNSRSGKKAKQVFACEACHKTYCTRHSLKAHLLSHVGGAPFKCDLCCMAFTRLGNYTRHRLTHVVNSNNEHRYQCEFCDRKFLQKCDLKRHMHIHDGTQPYRCHVCNRGYIRKSDLTVHTRFHTKERPFQCQECEKAFFQSGDLNRHMRSTHCSSTSLKCVHCNRKYVKEATLIRHMQTAHQDILQSVTTELLKHKSCHAASTVHNDGSDSETHVRSGEGNNTDR